MRFERYGEAVLPEIRGVLSQVYAEIYAEQLDDPFFSVAGFERRLAGQVSVGGWECVVAWDGEQVAGYAYGATLPASTGWWRKTAPALSPEDAHETGSRTVAVFEVMVREGWRGTGLAERVHEELVTARPEERATLLVEDTHPKVLALYESWGYRRIGNQRPFRDAPLYAVMVRDLARTDSPQ
ncbi:N-acetyltransferase family protein [Embleya sp. AB8]|uniref:GNAT family N-acetyltransferase n=1 Tax=Embleya sp. AB8 TaxID=3156304 RepID=UPI003C79211B